MKSGVKYLSTYMATDWPEKTWKIKLTRMILFFIPIANPDYESKLHLLNKWLIEFIEQDGELLPWREIGIDLQGKPIFSGPSKRNYGFWLDQEMTFQDFEGCLIDKKEFEKFWEMVKV
jgi:hypothetical protein